jgi:hypothetical protein
MPARFSWITDSLLLVDNCKRVGNHGSSSHDFRGDSRFRLRSVLAQRSKESIAGSDLDEQILFVFVGAVLTTLIIGIALRLITPLFLATIFGVWLGVMGFSRRILSSDSGKDRRLPSDSKTIPNQYQEGDSN